MLAGNRYRVFAGVAVLGTICSCGGPEMRGPRAEKILLIVVDTLRADALGCYGYGRPTSPAMDALADSGAQFLQARAQSPWTLPSLATILTGLYPHQHRAYGFGDTFYALPDAAETVAEILGEAGYATGAFVNTQFGFEPYGLHQGFATYSVTKGVRNSRIRDASATAAPAEEWIGRHAGGSFFLVVHFFDPHLKYEAPEEYRKRFIREPEYAGIFIETWGVFEELEAVRRGREHAGPADREHLRDLYDAEVAFADAAVGRLVGALESEGIREETLVILTADHGEEFWDHGEFEHGHSFYDEVIRVPLVLSWPERLGAGGRSDVSVGQIDIVPTILDAAGIEPPKGLPGSSLLEPETADREGRMLVSEAPLTGTMRACFVWRRDKLILFSDDSAVLTRPWEDVREAADHADTEPNRLNEFGLMVEQLGEELAGGKPAGADEEVEPVRLDEELMESLRQEGYLR